MYVYVFLRLLMLANSDTGTWGIIADAGMTSNKLESNKLKDAQSLHACITNSLDES